MKKITTILTMTVALFCLNFINTATAQDAAPEFKPSGKVYGQMFADWEYKGKSADSTNLLAYPNGATQYPATTVPTKYSSFDIRRVYLGYEYNFAENFMAAVTLSHEGNNFDASGNRSLLIKHAYLKWKNIYKGADLVIGQQNTPAYALMSEVIYGYRSSEKTILDMRGITKSSDMGISLQGKYMDGKLGYNLMYANNNSTAPENNGYKKIYADVYGKFMDKKIVVDLYVDDELTNLTPIATGYAPLEKSKMLTKLFVAYTTDAYTIGVEYFNATFKNYAFRGDTAKVPSASLKDTTNATPTGVSIWGHASLIKEKLGVYARYDMYNPDSKYSSARTYSGSGINGHVTESFLNVGLDWTPTKNVHIMPNVWMNSYKENADLNNARIYGTKKGYESTGTDMTYRITMFFKF